MDLSFEIKYYRPNKAYLTKLKTFVEGLRDTQLKVDTGASRTMITLGSLFNLDDCTEGELEQLKSQILQLDYPKCPIYTASNDEMIGILCHMKNVIVAEQKFSDFYFYLIPMFHEKALLGADFISCCEFVHRKNNQYPSAPTMFFQKFNESQYMCNYQILERCEALEIDSLSQMCDSINLSEAVKTNYNGKTINTEEMLPITSFDDLIYRSRKS